MSHPRRWDSDLCRGLIKADQMVVLMPDTRLSPSLKTDAER